MVATGTPLHDAADFVKCGGCGMGYFTYRAGSGPGACPFCGVDMPCYSDVPFMGPTETARYLLDMELDAALAAYRSWKRAVAALEAGRGGISRNAVANRFSAFKRLLDGLCELRASSGRN